MDDDFLKYHSHCNYCNTLRILRLQICCGKSPIYIPLCSYPKNEGTRSGCVEAEVAPSYVAANGRTSFFGKLVWPLAATRGWHGLGCNSSRSCGLTLIGPHTGGDLSKLMHGAVRMTFPFSMNPPAVAAQDPYAPPSQAIAGLHFPASSA